ncbi:PREDICTED: abrin-a-like [Populus euphratica]|uniref:Abrin-a-like n=1 Tax=Populus euphratica TaxID=75702 RepID=A0AAJ6T557_POPEU|nr:PREDICTED: abrin-a-like [Populus euphratica]
MEGNMKVWILALWVLLVAIHDHHVVANDAGVYTHAEPIVPLHASEEGRKAINDSKPFSIVGAGSKLCVSVNRFVPQLVDCKADTKEQKWEFHTDGTLRTETNLSMCLTCNDLTQGSDILVLPCNFSSSDYIFWRYRSSDYAIINTASASKDLVMDLREGQTEVPQQIFLWQSNGGDNQMWYLVP